jgi:hypothetical protein
MQTPEILAQRSSTLQIHFYNAFGNSGKKNLKKVSVTSSDPANSKKHIYLKQISDFSEPPFTLYMKSYSGHSSFLAACMLDSKMSKTPKARAATAAEATHRGKLSSPIGEIQLWSGVDQPSA